MISYLSFLSSSLYQSGVPSLPPASFSRAFLLKWAKRILKVPASPTLRVLVCQETSPSHGFNNFLDSVPVPAERFSLFSVLWSLLNLPKHIEMRTASPHESSHGSPFLQSTLHGPESGKVGPLLSGHRPSEVVFKSLPAPYCFPVLNLR